MNQTKRQILFAGGLTMLAAAGLIGARQVAAAGIARDGDTPGTATASGRQTLRQVLSRLGPTWTRLHDEVQRRAINVISNAAGEFAGDALTVGPFEGWRSVANQEREILEGDSFVTQPLRSFHPWGLAVDFVFIDARGNWTWLPDPNNPNDRRFVDPKWHRLGAIIERHGFGWGGRFSSFDGAHAQLPIMPIDGLLANYGTPDSWLNAEARAA